MKSIRIKIKKKAIKEIYAVDPTMDSKAKIEDLATATWLLTIDMLENALSIINSVVDNSSDKEIIEKYLDEMVFVKYFGTEALTVRQIKLIRKRLNRAYQRYSKKRTTVRFLSQEFYFSKFKNAYAVNAGYFITPKSFMVLPAWFEKSKNGKAGTFIHETFHDYFRDQKLHRCNYKKKKTIVYSSYTAAKLAVQNPKKARRSPENYEQLCEELWRIKTYIEARELAVKNAKSKPKKTHITKVAQ